MRSCLVGLAALLLLPALCRAEATSIKIGFHKDHRSAPIEVFRKSLGGGFSLEAIAGFQPEGLGKYDVLMFTGGWNAYSWSSKIRYPINEFAARGGGVLLTSYRAGGVRENCRALFPEVGYGGVRVAERLVRVTDRDHPVTQTVQDKYLNGYGEQLILYPGPRGKVLAVNSSNSPVLVAGDFHHGRVALYGSYMHDEYHPTLNPHGTNGLLTEEVRLLRNLLRWLAGKRRETAPGSLEAFKLEFARRERLLHEMNESPRVDSGKTGEAGVVTEKYWDLIEPVDGCLDQARYYQEIVPSEELKAFISSVERLRTRLEEERNRLFRERGKAIRGADLAGLAAMGTPAFLGEFAKTLAGIIKGSQAEAEWVRLDAKYRPVVSSELEKRDAAEMARDKRGVRTRIRQLRRGDARERRELALELGRIGDGRATKPLIRLLGDPDAKALIAAIQALGWLRASRAVPALIGRAGDAHPQVRRRIAQTLGMIGDARAYETLVSLLRDPDHYTRENAIYALGWLRDRRAVPVLIRCYEEVGQDDYRGVYESVAVLRALGDIGDEKALPFLEKVRSDCDGVQTMYPFEKWISGDFYWTSGSLKEHARLAIQEVQAAVKPAPGITQPPCQSLHENFYWISAHYYRGVTGRNRVYHFNARPKNLMRYPAYLRALGASGDLVSGATYPKENLPDDSTYEDFLNECDLMRVRMVDKIPLAMCYFGKGATLRSLKLFGHHRSFAGYWGEEALWPLATSSSLAKFYPEAYVKGRVAVPGLRRYIESRYPASQTAAEGLTDGFWKGFSIPRDTDAMRALRQAKPFLWAEFMEYLADLILEDWQEWQLWTSGVRKGTVGIWSHSEMLKWGASNFIKLYPNAGWALTADGPQSYNEHSWKNVFQVELSQDGTSRPVMPEIYSWYAPTPEYVRRGMASSFFHGGAFFEWYVQHVGRYMPPYWPWQWESGRWDAAKEMFHKGRRLSEYLMPVEQPTETALLFSGRTNDLLYGQENPVGFGAGNCGGRYFQNQQGLWQALVQSHLPVTVIWAETLTAEKLAPYQVLVVSNGRSLRAEEEALIRRWVEDGGCLIASGATTLHDQWGRARKDYALADVFGSHHAGATVAYQYDAAHTRPLELQLKPIEGLGRVVLPDGFAAAEAEFYVSLGYEKVRPLSAQIVAKYDDGDIALTSNRYGKGTCYHLTLEYPGISYTPWKFSGDSIRKTYWPGAAEFLSGLVRECLEAKGTTSIIETEGCPEYVEVAVRRQETKSRWLVHALNYDPDVMEVEPFVVSVRLPSVAGIRAERPGTGQPVECRVTDGRVLFRFQKLRDHQMVALSWE